MIRRPPRSTLFPSRRSSDLLGAVRHIAATEFPALHNAFETASLGHDDGINEIAHRKNDRGNNITRLHVERSEEHTSELQSQSNVVCRLLLEKKKKLKATKKP